MHTTLYLYRRKSRNPKAINQDTKFVKENSGFKKSNSLEGFITTNDLGIPTSDKEEKLFLPITQLQDCFKEALEKAQFRVAENKAREIRTLHGHALDHSSFEPASGADIGRFLSVVTSRSLYRWAKWCRDKTRHR